MARVEPREEAPLNLLGGRLTHTRTKTLPLLNGPRETLSPTVSMGAP